MIASFFLIPLVIFGSIAGYYHVYTPIKMHILIHLLRYDSTQDWAEKKIYDQGKKAAPYVVKGLWSENEEIRLYSGCILEDLASEGISDERITGRLIKLLSHPEARVRAGAATGLSILPDKRAAPELIKLLSDPHPNARASAAWALGRIGDERAVPHLIRLLSDPDGVVRLSAPEAIGEIGGEEHVSQLVKLLSDPKGWVREGAAQALGEIGSEEAIGALIKCLSADPGRDVRSSAAWALGEIGSDEVVEPLIQSLADPDWFVRYSAADALGETGSLNAVRPLIATLEQTLGRERDSDYWAFQLYLVSALEQITGQSFGEAYGASHAERRHIIQNWLDWWEENKEKYQEQPGQPAKE
jgi:HEAT repeat protein